MNIMQDEQAWVTERMNIYTVKYQEIYDELLDHILTAMENRRAEGNISPTDKLFQQVVDNHFGGYNGIEELAKNQENLHRKHVRDIFFKYLKSAFNWRMLIMAVIVLIAASTIANTKALHLAFALSVFVLAISPVISLMFCCIKK